MSFSICYGTFNGLGRHESDVPDQWQSALKKSQYTFSVLYVCQIFERATEPTLTTVESGIDGRENIHSGVLLELVENKPDLPLGHCSHIIRGERRWSCSYHRHHRSV